MRTAARIFCTLLIVPAAVTLIERPAAGSQAGAGVIAGRVVDTGTGRGLPDVVVSIRRGTTGPGADAVRTTRNGDFVFTGLAEGEWYLLPNKAGYLRARLNGARVLLGRDARLIDLRLELARHAAIEGTVLDEIGQPVVGAGVGLLARDALGDWSLTSTTVTDDRGVYRFFHRTGGPYTVAVLSTQATVPPSYARQHADAQAAGNDATRLALGIRLADANALGVRAGNENTLTTGRQLQARDRLALLPHTDASGSLRIFATTFHPAGPDISDARVIALANGEDRTGVDIRLGAVPAVQVAGRVTGPAGLVGGLPVHLERPGTVDVRVTAARASLSVASTLTETDGSFVFPVVPAGEYVLRVLQIPQVDRRRSDIDPTLWSSTPLSVPAIGLADVVVPVRRGLRIAGTVEFDGDSPRPTAEQLQRAGITPWPVGDEQYSFLSGRFLPGDRFTTQGAPANRYIVTVAGNLPAPWRLLSIDVRGQDIADTGIELTDRDIDDAVMTLTDRLPILEGFVRDERGLAVEDAIVLAFPKCRGRRKGNWFRFGNTLIF
jgi:hypothetical protein